MYPWKSPPNQTSMYVCMYFIDYSYSYKITIQQNNAIRGIQKRRQKNKKRIKEQKVMMVTLNKRTKKVLLNDLKKSWL